jgi:hypothetical protein
MFQSANGSSLRPAHSVIIQPRDVALLHLLLETRAIRRSHAAVLCFGGSANAAKKRIQTLKTAGLLGEWRASRTATGIVTLTRSGVAALKARNALPAMLLQCRSSLSRRLRPNTRTLAHDLAVLDVRCALTVAATASDETFLRTYLTHPESVRFGEGTSQVTPDGFCSIHHQGAEYRLFIEVDRSTRPLGRLAAQVRAYRAHYRSGTFAASIGEKPAEYRAFPFRVLYIVKSEERLTNLARTLLQFSPPITSLVWLATFDSVVAGPLRRIWRTPPDVVAGSECRVLFPDQKKGDR